jgi:hypothetical protein
VSCISYRDAGCISGHSRNWWGGLQFGAIAIPKFSILKSSILATKLKGAGLSKKINIF